MTALPRAALLALAVLLAPGAAAAALRGDVNLDNKVDTADVVVLSRYVRGEITLSPAALLTSDIGPVVDAGGTVTAVPDGLVDLRDLVVLSRLVGRQIGPAPPVLDPISLPGPNQAVQIAGDADPGATIHLFVNGEERELTATASGGGAFSFPTIALLAGPNKVYAVARQNGLTSGPSNVEVATFVDSASRAAPASIAGTVVWTPGMLPGPVGPFVINGTLTIAAAAKLILAPGTELRFATSASKLVVNGQLLVQGSEKNLVKFTSTGSIARGAWTGIEISNGSQGSEIRYARIEYAQHGVRISGCLVSTCSQAVIRRTVIREFSTTGIRVEASGLATILQNVIGNFSCPRGGTGISLVSTAAVWIEGNTDIRGANFGISISNSSPTIKANTIRSNNTGISISGSLSNAVINGGNVITGNRIGILTSSLWQNLIPPRTANPIVNRNAIHGNVNSTPPPPAAPVLINFEASPDQFYDEVLNAQENWWGTTVPAEIAATILDEPDGPPPFYRPVVDFSSYLDSEGGDPVEGYLSGVTTANRTLDPAVPYTVVGTYIVQAPHVLTIPAGTSLLFDAGAKLRVEGTLDVNGTSGSPVAFTASGPTPVPGAWQGIEISGAAAVADIDQALIEYATVAISAEDTDAVTISNSRIERFKETGIAMEGVGAAALVSGNTIDRLLPRDPAVEEIGLDLVDSSPTVTANEIHATDIGVRIYGLSQPRLGDLGPPLIPGNLISGNGVGIRLEGTWQAGGDPLPVIKRNDVFGNDTWNLETKHFSPGYGGILDVRENWWGTTDPAAIRATFKQDADNPVVLDFANFLDGPGGSPTTTATPLVNLLLTGISVQGGNRAFAPTLGEQAQINFITALTADVTLQIYTERVIAADRTPIGQTLVATQTQLSVLGSGFFIWDGRDQSGAYVPDEAYTYVLTATGGGLTHVFDPPVNGPGLDGHAVASIPTTFNVYQNDFLDFDVTVQEVAAEGKPFPSRLTVSAEPGTPPPSPAPPYFLRVEFVDSRPFVELVAQRLAFDGRDANGALITEPGGVPYASEIKVQSLYRDTMHPNYLIVRRVKPEVRGTAPPKIEVEAIPYFVTQSYDQVARFSFSLDQSAFVEVKILKPGYGDPDDPNAVLGTLPIVGSPAQPLAGGTAYSVEWRGHSFATPASNAPADGNYTFAIKATSAVAPAFHTVYRGVIQVRR